MEWKRNKRAPWPCRIQKYRFQWEDVGRNAFVLLMSWIANRELQQEKSVAAFSARGSEGLGKVSSSSRPKLGRRRDLNKYTLENGNPKMEVWKMIPLVGSISKFPGCKPLKQLRYILLGSFRHVLHFSAPSCNCSSAVRKSDGCACGGGDHDSRGIGKQWMPVRVCKQTDLKIQDSFRSEVCAHSANHHPTQT